MHRREFMQCVGEENKEEGKKVYAWRVFGK